MSNCQTYTGSVVSIETSMGTIVVQLYDDTPLHRDNFLKLVKQGTLNGTLFHRVIKDFMIQGGDPQSKGAPKSKMLGSGDVGYTIPNEINYPNRFHKRGALSAARTGDDTNPERASSGCQFYIVWGQTYKPEQMDSLENQMGKTQEQEIWNALVQTNQKEVMQLRRNKDQEGLMQLQQRLQDELKKIVAERGKPKLTEEQRNAYTTIGGTPHLDNQYTVFGEVIEGLEIVEKIQNVEIGRADRPEKDIEMKLKVLSK